MILPRSNLTSIQLFRHLHQGIPLGVIGGIMVKGCVVVKLGGGLITEKEKLCTPKLAIIDSLCGVIAEIVSEGYSVILVHGAGSFGHLKAKRWSLHLGRLDESELVGSTEGDISAEGHISSQDEAIIAVRKDMFNLNNHVIAGLEKHGISSKVYPPHEWVIGTGEKFKGDVSIFADHHPMEVKVTFGDVVACEGSREFGILSGDDLVYRIAVEVPNVSRLVFALGGVDGLLRSPPIEGEPQDLLFEWRESDGFSGEHFENIDVTGGIFLKAERGSHVANQGIEVKMVRGVAATLYSAMKGEDCRGTVILPN
jgi:isopentenyl phosphate kinase